MIKCERMWKFLNSREVGLEAAILKDSVTAHRSNRVSAEDVTGQNHTESVDL